MKTSRVFCAVLFVCMFLSCEHDRIDEQRTDLLKNRKFSIAQAQLWYETKASYDTRTEDDNQSDFFKMGEVSPNWDLGKLSSDYNKDAVDVPIAGEYTYHVVYDSVSYPLFSGLVVMNEKITSKKSDYHVFYIPSHDDVEYYTDEVCSYFRNRENRLLFSGLAVYTDEYGSPVAAERFEEGLAEEGYFLYDTTATFEYNYEKMYSLISGTKLLRIKNNGETRSGDDGINEGGVIDEIVVIATPLPPKKKDDDSDTPFPEKEDDVSPIQDLEESDGSGFDSGNSSGDSSSSNEYSGNSYIVIDSDSAEEIEELLDSLKNDCMGSTLINSITTDLTISTEKNNSNQAGGYYPSLGLITLTNPNDMTTLIEELVHCYQHITNNNHQTHGLNNEVEAKILWSMYVQRHGGALSDYGSKLGQYQGVEIFNDLTKEYSLGLNPLENNIFYGNYFAAMEILSNSSPDAYGDESKYSFSYDFDLSVIDYLLRNC